MRRLQRATHYGFICAVTATLSLIVRAEAGDAVSDDGQSMPTHNDSLQVSQQDRVELHVADMPLHSVLRMLSVEGKRNIVATPEVQGTVTADLYNVSFEDALKVVLTTNGCDYVLRDGFVHVYTNEELSLIQSDKNIVTAKVFRLNYVAAKDVAAVIEPLLSESGSTALSPDTGVGIKPNSEAAGGYDLAGQDYIVVYDYPDRLAKIGQLIKEVDVRPRQVLVEATILRARLTDDNALGVDFSLVGGVDLELLGSTSIGVQNLNFGQLPASRFEKFNSNVATNFTDDVPDGGLTIGVIKDHVAIFIRALEEITDSSVLANPKVLALNKQVANVIVGRRDGFITTTVTETQAVQKVEFLETGTQLTFRPFIGDDGYVRMEIHPEDSVGGLTASQLPFERTTEVTTNVIVRDGHTILIGGLFREVTTETRAQIPFFGDVPAVGDLFRSRNDALDREEVIILLTVHVIKNDDAYAELSSEQLQDIERARVSLRRGMMWHGRERLAHIYYEKAVHCYTRGDDQRALDNLQLALHNHPRCLSAIKLRETIEQKRQWYDSGPLGRNFVYEIVNRDRNKPNLPWFERPGPPFEQLRDSDVLPKPDIQADNNDG